MRVKVARVRQTGKPLGLGVPTARPPAGGFAIGTNVEAANFIESAFDQISGDTVARLIGARLGGFEVLQHLSLECSDAVGVGHGGQCYILVTDGDAG
jgi:hypothetical protein